MRNRDHLQLTAFRRSVRTTCQATLSILMQVVELIASLAHIVAQQIEWENRLTYRINWNFGMNAAEHVVYCHLSVIHMIKGVLENSPRSANDLYLEFGFYLFHLPIRPFKCILKIYYLQWHCKHQRKIASENQRNYCIIRPDSDNTKSQASEKSKRNWIRKKTT